MGFLKGNDSRARTLLNPLEGEVGDADLTALTLVTLSASGNITGSYLIGNGSQLTGIVATSSYGNANVVANLAALGSNPVSTTGNVSAGYVFGNGSQLTGLPATYGNANVVANLAALGSNPVSTTGNVSAGNLNVTGNIVDTGALSIITGSNGNIALAPNGTGIVTASGNISAVGNIAGNFILGNGSQLTGIVATSSYGNANVSNYLESGEILIIDAGSFIGSGAGLTNLPITYGNANVVANLAALGSNPVSTTSNVTAANFVGLGAGTPTISSTGNLDLSATYAVRVTSGTFRLPTFTTAAIANLTAVNGDMVYNNTTNKIQAYAGNVWGNITLT
jgi:filamentous hemagglutinin